MKRWKHILSFSCLLMLIFSYQNVDAQQNLAHEAYAIFEQSCLICHGENGAYTEALIIEHSALIDDGKVLPGDPEGSVFYQRLIETDVAKRMPLGQPALDAASIETIRQWILAGAPDWDAVQRTNPSFITTGTMLETITNHVNSLTPQERSFARYFTLTHLYNAGEATEALNAYRRALSKLTNSLSWGREVIKPQSIDVEETIYYIDLRDYEWDVRKDAWTQIEQVYPYKMSYDAPTQTQLRDKLTTLQQEMDCEVPFVHVDWFLATASLPPLYHDILALPETDRKLETALEVYVAENILNAPGKRVWRAGFNDSGVSRHNRVVERHISRYGAYWKSYDFAGSAESQNIFTHPLDFTHDGGEIIFSLPNGLQAYLLVDGNGNRLDVAPTDIVSNPAASDPAVRNGLSCIGCHTEGMKTFEDEVRAVVEQADNPPFNKARALDLYVEKTVMDDLIDEDIQRYRAALEAAGGVFGGIEPIQRFYEVFQGPLSAAHAASAVGFETNVFLEIISKNVSLQNLLGALVLENGAIKRDAWTSAFHDVIAVLDSPDNVLPPVEQRPERIPGAGVHIPDVNLRARLNEILEKPSDAPITIAEMESFTAFGFHGTWLDGKWIDGKTLRDAGIQNLSGLQFAVNIEELSLDKNNILDLSLIANLTNLTMLDISNNGNISDLTPITSLKKLRLFVFENCPEITSLSALQGLTELEHIQASHNFKISDLSPLAGKQKFKSILLWGPPVSDLSPLANLPNIEYINMCGNEISVIPSFENAPKLKKLYIFDNDVSDVSILENLEGLERLNLRNNKITDISPLAALTNLKWLNLMNNPISDFSPLAELAQTTNILTGEVAINDPNLRAAIAETLGKGNTSIVPITLQEMMTLTTLRASNREIKDLTGLEYAINLEEMWISGNPISNLSPLAGLKKLIGLGAWETPISDLSPLSGLTNLRWLDFGRTPTDTNRNLIGNLDLTPLAEITSLKKLTFYACGIQDISPLVGLTGLTHLAVGGNRTISDASPIAGLINLEHLDFHHDSISDLSPLTGLTKLKHLNLYDNRLISDLSPLARLTNLTHLELHRNMISDVSPLSGLTNLEKLFLQENLIQDISPLKRLFERTYINWLKNPGAPIGGQKIEGPWLWVLIPGKRLNSDTDLLAEASNGSVTEHQIATSGATEGKAVGNKKWTAHEISSIGRDNVREMLSVLGLSEDDKTRINVVYGSAILSSQQEQNTKMFVGTAGNHKIWLNGELIHEDLKSNRIAPHDYDMFFPITLEQGANILLVAVDNNPHWDRFECYFGFEEDTEYKVTPPGVGFTFSATETNVLAGDTFTLNLNAENIADLAGWQTDITFDPSILEAVEVTEGDFLKSQGGDTFFQLGRIDNTTGKITTLFSTRIAESGVSGTGTLLSVTFKAKTEGKTQVTLENFEFSSVSGDIIPTVPPNITITVGSYPAWDVNQDGRISIRDLVLVANDLGSDTPANLRTDVNRDGVINIQDLILVAQHIGESTDSAASPVPVKANKELMSMMIQTWIKQTLDEDDGSIVFRKGIENLQRLLASLLPEKTALLANYPNPFNPETWIPYQLAKPAKVTLTIYAANGVVVRTLNLGQQAAGIYQSRERAVYWDGKNTLGESAASGVYFYTLSAGDFTATRKMLILK